MERKIDRYHALMQASLNARNQVAHHHGDNSQDKLNESYKIYKSNAGNDPKYKRNNRSYKGTQLLK